MKELMYYTGIEILLVQALLRIWQEIVFLLLLLLLLGRLTDNFGPLFKGKSR